MLCRTSWLLRTALVVVLGLPLAGCQRARPYTPANLGKTGIQDREENRKEADFEPLPDDHAWKDPGPDAVRPGDARVEFVHQGSRPEEWNKLAGYWNDAGLAK